MPEINQLSATAALSSGDQIPIYDTSEGDARKVSVAAFMAYFRANFASPEFERVTAAPSNNGFTVTVEPTTKNVWLIINQTSTFADGTILLPGPDDCFDGQMLIVTVSEPITNLDIDGNGSSVSGEPSSVGSEGFFALRFSAIDEQWYCVSQSLGATTSFTDLTLTGVIKDGDGETMLAFAESDVGTSVNHLTVVHSITGDPVGFFAVGTDTDIDILLSPKGAGIVRVGGVEAVGTTGTQQLLDKTIVAGNLQNCSVSDGVLTWVTTTVGALGAAAPAGQKKFVTDATATTFASVASGGGANAVPVYSDGTNWRIG